MPAGHIADAHTLQELDDHQLASRFRGRAQVVSQLRW